MESELYKKAYQIVMKVYRKTNLKRIKFTDADIALTYLWAALHDRPTCWACKKKNWPIYYRRRPLPDASTMCRRLKTAGVDQLLKDVEKHTTQVNSRNLCRWIDAKGLLISNSSNDKQAGYGFAGGGMGKGYKLYAIADSQQGFVHWRIQSMNCKESMVARELINELEPEGYLVGDGAYDVNKLYDLADSRNIRLVAPKRIRNARGLGKRKHSFWRIEMLNRLPTNFIQGLLKARVEIEHMFGYLTNISFGLKPLPNWVRGLFRVENWVRAKMIFFNIWRQENALRKI
jgi:DDE family transposase